MSDVRSLYPRKGISDAVIDYYVRYSIKFRWWQGVWNIICAHTSCKLLCRCYQPHSPAHFVVSALSYSAIVEVFQQNLPTFEKEQRVQQRFKAACGRKLSDLFQDEMIIFPCKVQ